jgi:hypothetical protein
LVLEVLLDQLLKTFEPALISQVVNFQACG